MIFEIERPKIGQVLLLLVQSLIEVLEVRGARIVGGFGLFGLQARKMPFDPRVHRQASL